MFQTTTKVAVLLLSSDEIRNTVSLCTETIVELVPLHAFTGFWIKMVLYHGAQ